MLYLAEFSMVRRSYQGVGTSFSAWEDVMYKIVRSSRLYEQIVQQVEESIQKGALKTGDRLPPERELAQQFGVSRTAVREAVKALREKGFVEAYPGRGTFIMETSSHPIRLSLDRMMKAGQAEGSRYLTEVREMMEPEIAALAAERADAEDLAAMRESFEVMEGAQKDPDAFIEADLDFHLALAEAAGNPIILSLIDSIERWDWQPPPPAPNENQGLPR